MDFTVSEELSSVQQLAQQILNDFTAPEQLKAIDQQQLRFDDKLWQALAEAGLLVGRDFPPMLQYNRLSLGLPEEMARWADTIRGFRRRGWI